MLILKAISFIALIYLSVGAKNANEDVKPTQQSKLRVGVLNPEFSGTDSTTVVQLINELNSIVSEISFYDVFDHDKIKLAFEKIGQKLPRFCTDPRCAEEIGAALGMNRMIFGHIDFNGTSWGMQFNLLDVQTRQIIAKANIQGEAGISGSEMLKAAVGKLHGQSDEELGIKTKAYFGKQFHNEKELIFSATACLGAAIIWSFGNQTIPTNKIASAPWSENNLEKMAGIPTSAVHIPMFGRPAALANAYVAASDDACGVLYNPAAMAWVTQREVAMAYQRRFAGIQNFALAYVNKANREIGFGQAFFYSGDSLQNEVNFYSAFAYKFNHIVEFIRPFSLGTTFRFISINAPERENATAAQKTIGFGIDLGLLLELADHIRYGLLLRDALAMERVNNTVQNYTYSEFHPALLQMGGTYKVGYYTFLIAEGHIPLPWYDDQKWKMAGGIEHEFFRIIKGRIGIQKEMELDTPWKFTAGLGLKINTESILGKYLWFDAGYEHNTFSPFSGPTNISLRIGF